MSAHRASVRWKREGADFTYEGYSRDHLWTSGGGTSVAASAAPEYRGSAALMNPEEALVAALSSCHMLTFLAIAARDRLVVDGYEDEAEGFLEKNADGRLAITRVILRPRITFGGEAPSAEILERLHQRAHRGCFIASSVKTEVSIETPENRPAR